VIDVASDPTTSFTPIALRAAPARPAPTPTPEVAGVQAAAPQGRDVVRESFEPMFNGARIGLLASGILGLLTVGVQVWRRTRG
jgi:hypothetical protein